MYYVFVLYVCMYIVGDRERAQQHADQYTLDVRIVVCAHVRKRMYCCCHCFHRDDSVSS